MPLLSVITISLNAAATIEQTLESVLTQKTRELEYIVIDGGSEDGTRAVIDARRDEIDHIVFEGDSGVSDAFNKGIEFASGEFVGFLNADDYYVNDVIVKLDRVLRTSQAGLIYGDIYYEDPTSGFRYKESADATNLGRYMSVYHPALFLRRTELDSIGGYRRDYRYAMDCEMVHRALAQGVEFYHWPEVVACMRLRGVSHQHIATALWEYRRSVTDHGLCGPIRSFGWMLRQYATHQILKFPGVLSAWGRFRRKSL